MHSSRTREQQALTALRLCLAGLIFIHGAFRAWHGGYTPFGGWLESQGVPMGVAVAIGITALEVLGAPLLAWGRVLVMPLCLLFAAVYVAGIVMVHAPAGWFVVGAGRNGAEYSVLLIVGLLATAWVHAGAWRGGRD